VSNDGVSVQPSNIFGIQPSNIFGIRHSPSGID